MKPWPTLVLFMVCMATSAETRADVPGPRVECAADPDVCSTCMIEHATASEEGIECVEHAKSTGLVVACQERDGQTETVYLCPPGVTAEKVKQKGCGGCSLSSARSTPPTELAWLLLGLGAMSLRRRRDASSA